MADNRKRCNNEHEAAGGLPKRSCVWSLDEILDLSQPSGGEEMPPPPPPKDLPQSSGFNTVGNSLFTDQGRMPQLFPQSSVFNDKNAILMTEQETLPPDYPKLSSYRSLNENMSNENDDGSIPAFGEYRWNKAGLLGNRPPTFATTAAPLYDAAVYFQLLFQYLPLSLRYPMPLENRMRGPVSRYTVPTVVTRYGHQSPMVMVRCPFEGLPWERHEMPLEHVAGHLIPDDIIVSTTWDGFVARLLVTALYPVEHGTVVSGLILGQQFNCVVRLAFVRARRCDKILVWLYLPKKA